jgi:hypothetical protein
MYSKIPLGFCIKEAQIIYKKGFMSIMRASQDTQRERDHGNSVMQNNLKLDPRHKNENCSLSQEKEETFSRK